MSDTGVIKQIIGAVIDVEFDKAQIPNIYDALVVSENNLVLETQQLFLECLNILLHFILLCSMWR